MREKLLKIERWNRWHAIAMIAATFCSLCFSSLYFLVVFPSISISFFIFQNMSTLSVISPFGGYANWVTGFRFILLMSLTLVWAEIPNYMFVSGLITFVCLDGLDGWLARKYDQATIFGQYFDMELDALFVLIMCCYYYIFEDIGAWILVPALLRYIYKLTIDLFPKSDFIEQKKRYASTIAGIFFFLLIASLFVQGGVRENGLAIGSFLIAFSFVISAVEYFRFDGQAHLN